jgi:peptide chain release factor 3
MLQFDVMAFRLEHEYRAPCKFEPMGFRFPKWVTGDPKAIDRAGAVHGRLLLYDAKDAPVLLFSDQWALRRLQQEVDDLGLTLHNVAP